MIPESNKHRLPEWFREAMSFSTKHHHLPNTKGAKRSTTFAIRRHTAMLSNANSALGRNVPERISGLNPRR